MRTFSEAFDHARNEPPFSNGTEGYRWMDANCERCIHDARVRRDEYGKGCPLLTVTLADKTPSEWLDGPRDERGRYAIEDRYHCIEFRDEDDPGPQEPKPPPDPPGQVLLLDRTPYEAVRMFVQPQEETV